MVRLFPTSSNMVARLVVCANLNEHKLTNQQLKSNQANIALLHSIRGLCFRVSYMTISIWLAFSTYYDIQLWTTSQRPLKFKPKKVWFFLVLKYVLNQSSIFKWCMGPGGHSMSSRTPRARQKNLPFLICITQMDQNLIKFFSWVDIYNIYYILHFHNQIWWFVVLIKHTISN